VRRQRWRLSTIQFRRTLAWFIARRPGGTIAGRALLDDQRRDRRDRLAELLTALPAHDQVTLTLAMHVALPIIRRLIDDARQSRTLTDSTPRC
jgi:hypothetical protein